MLAVLFGRSVEFRSLMSRRPLVSFRPYVHPCGFNVHAKQTAAVNYLLYTALALEPILNDPSNLAGEERGRGRVEGE